jgi:hypothetical protein
MAAQSINPKLAELALEHCGKTEFERFSQTLFGAVIGPAFKPLGGHKDGGADGFVDSDIFEGEARSTDFFQASKEITVVSKIGKTIERLREYGREVKTLYFISSYVVKDIDKQQIALGETYQTNIRIYDRNFIVQHVNHNADTVAAFASNLRPALAFLDDLKVASFPSQVPFQNARAVCAFLGQELERRLGTVQTLEAICDALVLWALEGTDPAKNVLMSQEDITVKVESVIPTARRFFRGQVESRLAKLTEKKAGARQINIYKKEGKYCLPFETRTTLHEDAIEDEELRLSVSTLFLDRLVGKADNRFDTEMLTKIVSLIHRTLETVFELQGMDAARLFLDEDREPDATLDNRSIVVIAEKVLAESGLKTNLHADILSLIKGVLREVFYASTELERSYCGRLARTYILLFTIRNTPEVIEYFNTMTKSFNLYVGTDLVIRSISEHFLDSEDQMTVNAFKILRQAGSRLIMSEVALEEVHSHIWASHLEYNNTFFEIDQIVDHDLASQSDRILIRAYYYAKLNKARPKRPSTWTQYLNNFLTAAKLSGSTSEASMKTLRDTLCNSFGFEFEGREEMENNVDADELTLLTNKIVEIRSRNQKAKDDLLARNDALHILRVHQLRRDEDKIPSNPYGYKSWWLTQDVISGRAAALVFPNRRANRYVMRPEFLINYIAYNPTTDEVRQSLKSIFPSLLGIRLGARMDTKTLETVLKQLREAYAVDQARATAMVTEHSDALKSGKVRQFALKYTSAV